MTDEWDVGVDAEIEDRLLRKQESESFDFTKGVVSWVVEDPFAFEVGSRAARHTQTLQREMRWFLGVFGSRIG